MMNMYSEKELFVVDLALSLLGCLMMRVFVFELFLMVDEAWLDLVLRKFDVGS